MFAPLFLPLMAYLIYLWRAEKRPANWNWGVGLSVGLAVFLWLFSWALALLALRVAPGIASDFINSQCSGSVALCFTLTTLRRLSYIGGLLTLLALLAPAIAFLIQAKGVEQNEEVEMMNDESKTAHSAFNIHHFILVLILLGTLLVLAPDFVYLRDLFGTRLNTVFKFYYQAWMLWSLAAAFGVAVLLQKLHRAWGRIFRVGLLLVLLTALVYPVLALPAKTGDFQIPDFNNTLKTAQAVGDPSALQSAASVWTLDGARLFAQQFPDDSAAAQWLSAAPAGVIAEAVSKDAYSNYGRMAVYSGQPDVLGWWWHEYQWRGSVDDLVSPIQDLTCRANFSYNSSDPRRMRYDDMNCLYETGSWDTASEILAAYNIRYVVVGTLERQLYQVNEKKFQQILTPVFQQGQVVIYEVP
jgi:uncharacterized membrane protein